MRKSLYSLILLAAVGLLAYSNTFYSPFEFDDFSSITENPLVKNLDNFTASLKGYEYNPRRFIGYLSFALNYHVGGLDVTGYHIVNLSVHIINAVLVYLLVILIFRTPYFILSGGSSVRFFGSRFTMGDSDFIALFSALLFLSHPVQTQAVTYIVQRFTSLATLFYLLSVVFYIKGRLHSQRAEGKGQSAGKEERKDKPSMHHALSPLLFYAGSLLSAVCAMKTKEIAFTLPVVIILVEFIFFGSSLKKKLLFLLPVLLTLVVIPLSILGTERPLGEILSDLSEKTRVQSNISRGDYLMTEMRVITTYIRLIFFPVNQNLDYDYPVYHSFFSPPVLLSFLFLVSIFGVAIYLLYRSQGEKCAGQGTGEGQGGEIVTSAPCPMPYAYYRLIAFGIFWFFITLSVESSVIPIADVIFEHRLYLPSVGAFISIAASAFWAAERLGEKWPVTKKILIPLSLALIVLLAGASFARNTVWQTESGLWGDVVEKSPSNARAQHNLGLSYQNRKMADEAAEQYRIALTLKPDYAIAHNNLGLIYAEKGLTNKTIEQYRSALRVSPDYAAAHNNLGM